MSIIQSLKRLLDPIQHRQQAEDLRRQREALPGDDQPGPPPAKPKLQRCRVCQYEGEGEFCPRCLAATMQPKK